MPFNIYACYSSCHLWMRCFVVLRRTLPPLAPVNQPKRINVFRSSHSKPHTLGQTLQIYSSKLLPALSRYLDQIRNIFYYPIPDKPCLSVLFVLAFSPIWLALKSLMYLYDQLQRLHTFKISQASFWNSYLAFVLTHWSSAEPRPFETVLSCSRSFLTRSSHLRLFGPVGAWIKFPRQFNLWSFDVLFWRGKASG